MTATSNRITFWFGCNMLRHAELIRLSMRLLEHAGYDVEAAGGPGYCCGSPHDGTPQAASTMAARTIGRFNEAVATEQRGTVVTWCPSCHMQMSDIMAPGTQTAFDIAHITQVLAGAADKIAPLLTVPVERRVLLHRHQGFATHVPVNDKVAELLRLIPGLDLIEGPPVPGHMCSSLVPVAGALAKAAGDTWAAAKDASCDTVATIFHSCHREMAGLDGRDGVRLRNWVHLLAESMGLDAADAYLGWRHGAAPPADAIARADARLYAKLVEPELKKPAPI